MSMTFNTPRNFEIEAEQNEDEAMYKHWLFFYFLQLFLYTLHQPYERLSPMADAVIFHAKIV